MLKELRIKNFALVEDGRFELSTEMVSFTGETGAGKSLLLDAITLLLGAKAHSDVVRTGAQSAEVEGVFDLSLDEQKQSWAHDQGFEVDLDEGGLLTVRREISSKDTGKNRIWIQGKSSTRAELQKLLSPWVEVSGQHEFLRLGKEDYLLSIVDHFGGLKDKVRDYQKKYKDYLEAKKHLEDWKTREGEREQRLDYLKFQMEEFEKAEIHDGLEAEENSLISMRAKLGSVEKIRVSLHAVQSLLRGEEGEGTDIVAALQKALRELRPLTSMGSEFESLVSACDALTLHAEDFDRSLEKTLAALESDPESLEKAEQRLSNLQRLKRKYGQDTQGLIQIFEQSKKQFEELTSSTSTRQEYEKRFKEVSDAVLADAEKLFSARQKASRQLSDLWQKDIRLLGMKHAELQLKVEKNLEMVAAAFSQVEAQFSANPGESAKPLGKVASGGELSRIMLALKNLVASQSEVAVYLFDEVDSGIGGETAQIVGERLQSISRQNQVLVVTHLPQIAAFSEQQFAVEKSVEKGRTKTQVTLLGDKDRLKELSRMLGASGSKTALGLAEELLKRARSLSQKAAKAKIPSKATITRNPLQMSVKKLGKSVREKEA
jgi:DNA repair protein RecN (Recombination protein N)